MREMEFRGKQEDWEYGGFYTSTGYAYIVNWNGSFEVDIKSVGEYTGLKDKNGKKIFEGDVIETRSGRHAVIFEDGGFFYGIQRRRIYGTVAKFCAVVGNIYENPSLTFFKK